MDQTDPDCPGETPPPVQRDAFADPPLEPSRRRQGGREEAAAPPHTLWWISTASLGEWYLPSSAELPGLAFRLVTSLSNPCSPSFLSSQTGFLSAPKASHGPYVYREVSYVLLCSKDSGALILCQAQIRKQTEALSSRGLHYCGNHVLRISSSLYPSCLSNSSPSFKTGSSSPPPLRSLS